jgi:UDP-N-acetylglucosamine:LPS N-acetylglucosamine transferase
VGNDASAEMLLGKIVKLLSDPLKAESLGKKLGATAKLEAASDLADILLNIANKQ